MKVLRSKFDSGCTGVVADLYHRVMDGPRAPTEEEEPVPAQAAARTVAVPVHGPPPPPPPSYEFEIEPVVYLCGHGLCMLASLATLWMLLQSPMTAPHLAAASGVWVVFAYCSFRMMQGVRYGCRVRVYRGYLEIRKMRPTLVVPANEVAYFKELNRESRTRRRICLYFRDGRRISLPCVHDPELLRRALAEDVGLEQAIL